jgi:hypothetical protein
MEEGVSPFGGHHGELLFLVVSFVGCREGMMLSDHMVFTLREGIQQCVPGGLVSLFDVVLTDPLSAELGVSTSTGRQWLTLAVGEQSDVPGLGLLELCDVRVAPPGKRSSVVLDLLPG